MKKACIWTLLGMSILFSCSDMEEQVANAPGIRLQASFEQGAANSRLAVGSNNTLAWTAEDAFVMFDENGAKGKWILEGEGGTSGTFVGAVPEGALKGAAYPSAESTTLNDDQLTMTLSSVLTYDANGKCNLPMWASFSSLDGNITFKHLGALLKVNFTDIPSGYTSLIVTASNPIAGTFVADLSKSEPVLVALDNAVSTVTVNFVEVSGDDDDRIFYVPLPVGEYTSISVSISNGTDTKLMKDWSNKTIERAKIYVTSLTYQEVDAEKPSLVSTALQEIEVSSVQLLLTETVDATAEDAGSVDVPTTLTNLDMIFSNVPTTSSSAPLTINSNAESASTTASQTFSIDIPTSNDGESGVYLTLNTPTATATLNNGIFEEVSAKTATNTLIINGGVAIKKLTIYGGNVLIEAGTAIETIDNRGGGTINYIVKSEDGLMQAFEDGGKYIVYNDFTISDTNGANVGADKSVVLDLNDKTITAAGDAFVAGTGTTLTLNGNGFVKAGNTIGSWVAVWANGGTVTINDGNYSVGLDNGDSNSCVYVKNGGKVTINGGQFSHAIPTMGNNYGMPLQVNNDDTQGKITVNGGVFVLDNGRYYEEQDRTAGKIEITAAETIDNGKVIVSGSFGNTIVIENVQLSDALYKLYGDVYYITINSNGYAEMRESEVLKIRELNLDSYYFDYQCSITTLKGIENFSNLQYLECRNAGLEECDLSKNTELCSFATHYTQLTSLDFSKNPKIQGLYLNYNEKLSSLDLSGCTQLGNLQLFGSALTTLEIPNKKAMYNLLIGNSIEMDLTEFTNLSFPKKG